MCWRQQTFKFEIQFQRQKWERYGYGLSGDRGEGGSGQAPVQSLNPLPGDQGIRKEGTTHGDSIEDPSTGQEGEVRVGADKSGSKEQDRACEVELDKSRARLPSKPLHEVFDSGLRDAEGLHIQSAGFHDVSSDEVAALPQARFGESCGVAPYSSFSLLQHEEATVMEEGRSGISSVKTNKGGEATGHETLVVARVTGLDNSETNVRSCQAKQGVEVAQGLGRKTCKKSWEQELEHLLTGMGHTDLLNSLTRKERAAVWASIVAATLR